MGLCRRSIRQTIASGRREKKLFFLIILTVINTSCINTALEVSKDQWNYCHKTCGIGRLHSAGIDWFSGEETCTCIDRNRYRMEPMERRAKGEYE